MLAAIKAEGRSPNVLLECWMDELKDRDETLVQENAWVKEGIIYLNHIAQEA
jgi:hypothetical protein